MRRNHLHIYFLLVQLQKKKIQTLENISDNLLISRSEKPPFRLFLKVERAKDVLFDNKEIQIPIKPETLQHLKKVAEHSRNKVIQEILKI